MSYIICQNMSYFIPEWTMNNINMNMEMTKIHLKNKKKRNLPAGEPFLTVQKAVGSRNLKIKQVQEPHRLTCRSPKENVVQETKNRSNPDNVHPYRTKMRLLTKVLNTPFLLRLFAYVSMTRYFAVFQKLTRFASVSWRVKMEGRIK